VRQAIPAQVVDHRRSVDAEAASQFVDLATLEPCCHQFLNLRLDQAALLPARAAGRDLNPLDHQRRDFLARVSARSVSPGRLSGTSETGGDCRFSAAPERDPGCP